jgi:hypothetical protein
MSFVYHRNSTPMLLFLASRPAGLFPKRIRAPGRLPVVGLARPLM